MLGKARDARKRGDHRAALGILQDILGRDPTHIAAQIDAAQALRELGRLDEAEAAFRRVIDSDPAHVAALLGLGSVLRKRGDRNASLAAYEAAAAADPAHLGARMEVAYDLRELARFDEAEAAFRRALDLNAKHVPALLGLGSVLRKRDRNASLAAYAAAVAADPAHAAAKVEAGYDLRELGRLAEAEAMFRRALADQPKHVGALLALGRLLRQRNDRAGALTQFETAIAADPRHVGAKSDAAVTLRELGRRDEAEAMYRRILEAEPQHAGALLGLGNLMTEQYRFDEAEHFFQQAVSLNAKNVQGLMALGSLARRRRDRAAAIAYYEAATLADPAHVGAKLEFAAELRDRGDYARAHAIIDSVLASDPRNLQALMHRGQTFRRQGERQVALAAFQEAYDRHPGHVQALVDMAIEHLGLGKPDEAQLLLQRALEQEPRHLGALMQAAENAWLAEDAEKCLEYCLQAIAAHPQTLRSYLTASRAAADLGDRDHAEGLLAQATERFGKHPDIQAKRVEMARQARHWETAQSLLQEAGDDGKSNFPLWVQSVQLALNLRDDAAVEALLREPPATSTTEMAQAHVYRGQYAEARWRFDEAIAHYRAALALNPYHTFIHSEMARACLLELELDAAAEHLRTSAKLKVSRNLLRGWSLNISQNSLGQIFDEFALDRAVIAELREARARPLDERIPALQRIVRANPDNTAAALSLIIAMRQAGAFADVATVTDPSRVKPIPRRIIQFWDAVEPPADILQLTRSWSAAHPDFEHVMFNDATAKAFLAAHYNAQVVRAFVRARHPAQRADIFRLAYLTINGGFYIDADDRCNRRIDSFVAADTALALYQENYGTIGNNFIGAMPGHPLLAHALRLGTEAINRGDNDILWLCTGPGLVTRAFAHFLSGAIANAGDWRNGTAVLELGQIQRSVGFHCRVVYKKTAKHWSHASFRRVTRRDHPAAPGAPAANRAAPEALPARENAALADPKPA